MGDYEDNQTEIEEEEVYDGSEAFTPWDGQSKPELEQFDSHEEFVEALAGWKADQKLAQKPPSGPSGQQPPQAPVSRHMEAARRGTDADKARVPKIHEALENAQHFQAEAHRAAASGNQKSAQEYQQRAEMWAKEFHDLAMPAYEIEKMHDEQLDLAVHIHALENPDEFSQSELDLINAKSPSRQFLIKVDGKTQAVTLPEHTSSKKVFEEMDNPHRVGSLTRGEQARHLRSMGLNVPVELEGDEALSQNEYETKHSERKPKFTSAFYVGNGESEFKKRP